MRVTRNYFSTPFACFKVIFSFIIVSLKIINFNIIIINFMIYTNLTPDLCHRLQTFGFSHLGGLSCKYKYNLYTHWKGSNVLMLCIYIIYLVYTLEGFKCINVLYIYIIYLVYTLKGFKCINVLYICIPCIHTGRVLMY